jgi:hypothetical protein
MQLAVIGFFAYSYEKFVTLRHFDTPVADNERVEQERRERFDNESDTNDDERSTILVN